MICFRCFSIMNAIITGVAIILLVNSALATDYCRRDLCPDPTKTHVGCRNPGVWNKTNCGVNPQLHKLTEADQKFILHWHNDHRNQIASGSVPRFLSAANMKEVTWSEELANIACMNVISCKFGHDECRNTDKHKHGGQNIAIFKQTSGYKPFREAYDELHTKWFLEHKHCDMNNIRKYSGRGITMSEPIGHFTQLVSDRMDELGCGVSMFEKNGYKNTYTVCNYSYTNMMGKPIYVEGRLNCKKPSQNYKHLCAELF